VVRREKALIGDPHINIGLVPGDGGLAVWTMLAGPNRTKEFMMLGATANAEEALRLGLVNRVVEPEAVVSTAQELAIRLASGPQVGLRGTKISINNWINAQFTSLFEVSLAAELQSMAHRDFAEGAAAAIEKRTPNFE
jgi:enoyl-CoA hydratase/carnithine racemase